MEPSSETYDVLLTKAWNYIAEEFEEIDFEELCEIHLSWLGTIIDEYDVDWRPEDVAAMLRPILGTDQEETED